MELKSKINIGVLFLLCVIGIYNKYARLVILKDTRATTITNTFQKILDEPGPKPNIIFRRKWQ